MAVGVHVGEETTLKWERERGREGEGERERERGRGRERLVTQSTMQLQRPSIITHVTMVTKLVNKPVASYQAKVRCPPPGGREKTPTAPLPESSSLDSCPAQVAQQG